jgi:hypothetical protein
VIPAQAADWEVERLCGSRDELQEEAAAGALE